MLHAPMYQLTSICYVSSKRICIMQLLGAVFVVVQVDWSFSNLLYPLIVFQLFPTEY